MPTDPPGIPVPAGRPIRVLRLIARLNVGGPAIQAITLTERLAERGFQTLLVYGRLAAGEGDMSDLLRDPPPGGRHAACHPNAAAAPPPSGTPGWEAVYVPSLRRRIEPVHDGLAFLAVWRLIRSFRPDIVHTHTAKAGTVGRAAAALYNRTAGRNAQTRVVHTYHGHVLEGYFSAPVERIFTATERRLAGITDAIVTVSPRVRHELLDVLRIGRTDQHRVIPLGFDLQPLAAIDERGRHAARQALGIDARSHVVSTVGRLTPIKQHRLFLETARRVVERDPEAVFLLAGDGELRPELERFSGELGIRDRTRFLGWRRDLAVIYGASDVFLLTSRNEGTPVALIESLASGVPAVSTDVGGVRDVLDGEDLGYLAAFGDSAALANAVLDLLADPARRRAMGGRGRQAMVARFGVDRLIDEVEALYRDLLQRARPLPPTVRSPGGRDG
jgi:glycosyltransferase involved in cell wall biosynthesis